MSWSGFSIPGIYTIADVYCTPLRIWCLYSYNLPFPVPWISPHTPKELPIGQFCQPPPARLHQLRHTRATGMTNTVYIKTKTATFCHVKRAQNSHLVFNVAGICDAQSGHPSHRITHRWQQKSCPAYSILLAFVMRAAYRGVTYATGHTL